MTDVIVKELTVQDELAGVVQWALGEPPSRLGYFAALYSRVARAIHEHRDEFEHQEWLDELNRTFYRRYSDALDSFRSRQPAPRAWQAAFDAARDGKLLVVQHVLLGANAHINVDLAVATARTIRPEDMPGFAADFHRMNDVLGEVIDETCRALSKVWPFLGFVNRHFLREEDAVLKFSLSRARENAWRRAQELVRLDGDALDAAIDGMHAEAVDIAHRIITPDQPLHFIVQVVRHGELRSVRRVIEYILDLAR